MRTVEADLKGNQTALATRHVEEVAQAKIQLNAGAMLRALGLTENADADRARFRRFCDAIDARLAQGPAPDEGEWRALESALYVRWRDISRVELRRCFVVLFDHLRSKGLNTPHWPMLVTPPVPQPPTTSRVIRQAHWFEGAWSVHEQGYAAHLAASVESACSWVMTCALLRGDITMPEDVHRWLETPVRELDIWGATPPHFPHARPLEPVTQLALHHLVARYPSITHLREGFPHIRPDAPWPATLPSVPGELSAPTLSGVLEAQRAWRAHRLPRWCAATHPIGESSSLPLHSSWEAMHRTHSAPVASIARSTRVTGVPCVVDHDLIGEALALVRESGASSTNGPTPSSTTLVHPYPGWAIQGLMRDAEACPVISACNSRLDEFRFHQRADIDSMAQPAMEEWLSPPVEAGATESTGNRGDDTARRRASSPADWVPVASDFLEEPAELTISGWSSAGHVQWRSEDPLVWACNEALYRHRLNQLPGVMADADGLWGADSSPPNAPPNAAAHLDPDQADGSAEFNALRRLISQLNAPVVGSRGRLPRPVAKALITSSHHTCSWSPLTRSVLEWLCALLTQERVVAATAARYLSSLRWMVLAPGYGQLNPGSDGVAGHVDPDHWEAMTDLLASASTDVDTGRVFQQWLAYARQRHPILAPLDAGELAPHHAVTVRAHVITPDVFEAAMRRLPLQGYAREGAALLAATAFYSGLRRGEAVYTRVCDLVDPGNLLLLVRHHAHRGLKTERARRDLPLAALLPAHWRDRLHAHVLRMQAVDSPSRCAYLFASLDTPQVAPHAWIDGIVGSLRDVTGDRSVTFHGLRHSCATWTSLKLALLDCPALRLLPMPVLRTPAFEATAVQAWARAWLPMDDGLPHVWLYHLARLMGHSSPSTTLHYYCHLWGFVEMVTRSVALPRPRRATLIQLSGVGQRPFERSEERVRAWARAEGVGAPPAPLVAARVLWDRRTGLPPGPTKAAQGGSSAPIRLDRIPLRHVPLAEQLLAATCGNIAAVSAAMLVPGCAVEALSKTTAQPARTPALQTREHQQRFVAVCGQLERLHAKAPGRVQAALRCWREGRVVRTTRRAISDARGLPSLFWLLGQALPLPQRILIDLVPLDHRPRHRGDRAQLLGRLCRRMGVSSDAITLRLQTARGLGWDYPPQPRGRGFEGHWLLLRPAGLDGNAACPGTIGALDTAARVWLHDH